MMMFRREAQAEKHNHAVEESYKRIKKTKQEIQQKSQKLREILVSEEVCLEQEAKDEESK
jgi:uncharacterized membrane protein